MDTDHKKCSEKGFSLIEIAIAMVVIGLLIGPILQIYNINKAEKQYRENNQKLEVVSVALNKYAQQNHRFPSPAVPTLVPADAQYGTPAAHNVNVACTGVEASSGIRCILGPANAESNPLLGRDVLMGAVPFKALGLNEEDSYDMFGSKITYAISRNLVGRPAPDVDGIPDDLSGKVGSIGINNLGNNALNGGGDYNTLNKDGESRVLFVVISHGPDRKGAYQKNGTLNACPAGPALDNINCQQTAAAIFRGSDGFEINRDTGETITEDDGTGTMISKAKLTKSFSLGGGANHYDDTISFRTKASDDEWTAIREDVNTENTYLTKPMQTVIGEAMASGTDPVAIMTVNGDVLAKQSITQSICSSDQSECFRVRNISGPPVATDAGSIDGGVACSEETPLANLEKGAPAATNSNNDSHTNDKDVLSGKFLKRNCATVKTETSKPINNCGERGIQGFNPDGTPKCV